MAATDLLEITLVEDNSYDEELTLAGIHSADPNCKVTVQRDGAAALEFLLRSPNPPSLIILDYKLPKLNGLEVLTQVKLQERLRTVPVVIFSGTNVGPAMQECYRTGANSCVTKPHDASEYVAMVKWITHYWLNVNQLM